MTALIELLRKAIDEIIEQVKDEAREFITSNNSANNKKTNNKFTNTNEALNQKKEEKTATFKKEQDLNHIFTIDITSIRKRVARAVILAAAAIYAWAFLANPVVFIVGFGIAIFELLVGFSESLAWMISQIGYSLSKHRDQELQQQNLSFSSSSWVEKTEMYKHAREKFQEMIHVASLGVALPGSPTTKARKYLRIMVAVAPAMIMGGGVAAAFIHPVLILLTIAPAFILVLPLAMLNLKKAERREIDEEIPFFLILAEMFAFIERPLIQAFEALAKNNNNNLLTKMQKEAEIVKRDVSAFGYTPAQAIDNLANNHPNPEFCQILRGYLSSVALGQSASAYFQNKAEMYLARLESKYERFKENVGTAGELMLIALMIVPITGMMLGASSTAGGGGAIIMSNLILAGSIPLIAIAVFFMLDKAQVKGPPPVIITTTRINKQKQKQLQPRGREPSQIIVIPFASGVIVAFVAFLFFTKDINAVLLVSVAAFAIPHGFVVRRKLAREDALLSELADFIRTIAEGMKTGLDVVSAIRHTKVDSFNAFQPYIRNVQSRLRRGETLADVIAVQDDFSSHFHTKYAIFVMAELASSGSASFAMLDRLAEYLGRVREYMNKTKKAVALYGFLVISSPLFMVFTTHSMQFMMSTLKSQQQTKVVVDAAAAQAASSSITPTLNVLQGLSIDPFAAQVMLLLTTLCAGVLGGKIANQTLRDTIPLGISCILALISPMLIGLIWPTR